MKKSMKKKKNNKSKVEKRTTGPGIKPFGDRVLIKPFTQEDLREAQGEKSYGIILPESMTKEKAAQGKVVAVGDGKWDDGVLVPIRVKTGDIVVFSKYSYDEVEQGGVEYYLVKEENILAVIK